MDQLPIGRLITQLRLDAGLDSLGQLSKASGVTVATISRIESGVQRPTPETLMKIAPSLMVSVDYLLREAGYLPAEETTDEEVGPLKDRLSALRRSRGLSQDELAKHLCITRPAYTAYESGRRKPDMRTVQKLAAYFGVSTDYLSGATDDPTPVPRLLERLAAALKSSNLIMLPILGTIRAGIPVMAEENFEGEVEIPSDWRADFALRVVGDSMSWAGIHEGDIAALRHTTEAQSGMIVAAGIEDDTWLATLKYFIRENGHTLLRAANPEYNDIPVTDKHRIIGTLVGVLKDAPSYQEYRALLTSKTAADREWSGVIETATEFGLSGERVRHMIQLFADVSKKV